MAKAVQYYNGTDYTQFGLDVADYTLNGGQVANVFYTIKDSGDNVFILCYATVSPNSLARVIRVSKTGVKTKANFGNIASRTPPISKNPILLTRDESTIITTDGSNGIIWLIPTNFAENDTITTQMSPYITGIQSGATALYQYRYIWVASGTTVKIYDYTTKAELASSGIGTYPVTGMACDTNNTLYLCRTGISTSILMLVFNGTNNITQTSINNNSMVNTKQLLIDKYGDLIILTNSGTASTLLKYTTEGVQVGTTLDLSGAFYNLNTDKDGNYYYSNALGTYKITANTAQGEAFTGAGTKIRGSGMTSYNNNITGYNPAVFGTQE